MTGWEGIPFILTPFHRGKRRVYSESAVAVLREIAELRNSGKAFADIEAELAKRHPVRGEPEPETLPPGNQGKSLESAVNSPLPRQEEEFALIAKQQSDELGRIIGESFQSMAQRMEELERLSRRQSRMSILWLFLALFFLLSLIFSGVFYHRIYVDAQKEKTTLLQKQAENTAKITALREESISLIAGSKAFQSNITRLEMELKDQKTAFEKGIREAQKALADVKNAEIAAEKKRSGELLKEQESRLAAERNKALAVLREKEARLALEKEKFAAERLQFLRENEKLKLEKEKGLLELKKKQGAVPPAKVEIKEKTSPPPKTTATPATASGKEASAGKNETDRSSPQKTGIN